MFAGRSLGHAWCPVQRFLVMLYLFGSKQIAGPVLISESQGPVHITARDVMQLFRDHMCIQGAHSRFSFMPRPSAEEFEPCARPVLIVQSYVSEYVRELNKLFV